MERAREVADTLVQAGLIQRIKVVGGDQFYSMPDEVRQYAKTMILPDETDATT